MLASVAFGTALDGAPLAWREVRLGHFVLRSRIDVKQLQNVGCNLQQVVSVVDHVHDSVSSSNPVSVIAVTGEPELRNLLPQFWEEPGARPIGGYWSGAFGQHIVIRVDAPAPERERRMRHEYAHAITHSEFADAPPWFDEGLSELWTYSVAKKDGITIGQPVSQHLKLLRSDHRWIPIGELMAAGALPPASDRDRLARFYAESWALVHYMVFERNAGRLLFGQIPDRGMAPSDQTLQRYIHQSSLQTVRVPITPGACGPADVRELSPLESLLQLAGALADGPRPALALRLLAQAETIAPGNAEVIEMNGVVAFRENRLTAAAAMFDRVIASGQATHVAYYYRAVLAEAVPLRGDGSGPVPVGEYLSQSLRLRPGFAPARERLAALHQRP